MRGSAANVFCCTQEYVKRIVPVLCRSPSLLRLPESQEDSMSLPWGYKQQGPSLIRADKLCAELVQLCEGFKHLKVRIVCK